MLVGVPKEIKPNEFRVGLTPAAVREYAAHGHRLLAETGCGEGIGAADDAYARAGAEIVGTSDEVFTRADMIVKVKEPQAQEWRRLREGQILFTYLHLAPDRAQTDGLLKSGCTAVAYETVTDAHGGLPLLAPMSEVAGRLSIEAAGAVLRRTTGGRGLLVIDDLVDTGTTARVVREMFPQAHLAAVYAKPMGKPLVDTFITEVSQDTWIFFPWDTGLSFQPPIRDGAA